MAVCCLCVCVSGVPAYVMSGRELFMYISPNAKVSKKTDVGVLFFSCAILLFFTT